MASLFPSLSHLLPEVPPHPQPSHSWKTLGFLPLPHLACGVLASSEGAVNFCQSAFSASALLTGPECPSEVLAYRGRSGFLI